MSYQIDVGVPEMRMDWCHRYGDDQCQWDYDVTILDHRLVGLCQWGFDGEKNALSLTQENIINLHKSKGCTKIHKSQNPTKYMFVFAR